MAEICASTDVPMNAAPYPARRGLLCFRPPLLVASATFAVVATAQAPAPVPESARSSSEIIVTAQRRQEDLQQIPVSVTALTSRQLTDFGMKSFADYAGSVPNLSFGMGGSPYGGPAYGFSSTRQIVIRGLSGTNTTSLYIDDTPIPNVVDPRVLDLERVEVLRGPQGTLFGASSMGGTIRLITKTADPGAMTGNVDFQAFGINAAGAGYDVSGSLNVPVVPDNVGLRVSVFDTFTPGYFTRVFGVATIPGVNFAPGEQVSGSSKLGDTRQYGGVASVLITPEAIPGLSIVPLAMLQRTEVNGYPLTEGKPDNFVQVRPLDVGEHSRARWQFYAISTKYAATYGDLIASTSFFRRYSRDDEDGTMWFAFFQSDYYSPLPYLAARVLQAYESREFTQELRFQSRFRGPLQFVAGLFYQRSPTSSPFSYPIPGLDAASGYRLQTDNIAQISQETLANQAAGFVDVTYSPLARLELSAGVRKAWLESSGHYAFEQPPPLNANIDYSFVQKERPVTPRFAVKYSFDSGDMMYASASKGFRIGGENAPSLGPCAEGARELGLSVGVPIPYHSDSLWSYELGVKDLWDQRRISTRSAAYYIDWKNIQQTLLLPVCGIPALLNAGAARVLGGETELTAHVTPGLEIDAGVGYEDGKITQAMRLPDGQTLGFPVGTPLSGVPEWTASVRAVYSIQTPFGVAFARGECNFVGASRSFANGGAGLTRAEYALADLRGGLRSGAWTATVFIKNLGNTVANYGDLVPAAGTVPGHTRFVVAQPRTVGLELQWSFGAQ